MLLPVCTWLDRVGRLSKLIQLDRVSKALMHRSKEVRVVSVGFPPPHVSVFALLRPLMFSYIVYLLTKQRIQQHFQHTGTEEASSVWTITALCGLYHRIQ